MILIRFLNYINDQTFIHPKRKPQLYNFGPKEPSGEKLRLYESRTISTRLMTKITSMTELLSIIILNNPDLNLKHSKIKNYIHPRPKPHQLNNSRSLSIIRTFMHHVSMPTNVNLCFKLHEWPNLLPSKI